MPKKAKKQATKRGPKPDRLAITGDWQEAMKKALGVERPAEGWPPPAKKALKRGVRRR
jgi:hypothetical protein